MGLAQLLGLGLRKTALPWHRLGIAPRPTGKTVVLAAAKRTAINGLVHVGSPTRSVRGGGGRRTNLHIDQSHVIIGVLALPNVDLNFIEHDSRESIIGPAPGFVGKTFDDDTFEQCRKRIRVAVGHHLERCSRDGLGEFDYEGIVGIGEIVLKALGGMPPGRQIESFSR